MKGIITAQMNKFKSNKLDTIINHSQIRNSCEVVMGCCLKCGVQCKTYHVVVILTLFGFPILSNIQNLNCGYYY